MTQELSPEVAAAYAARQQQLNASRMMLPPMAQDSGLVRWTLQLQESRQLLEHDLRGDKLNPNARPGQDPWVIAGKGDGKNLIPNMNDEGTTSIIGFIDSSSSKLAPLTQYTEEQINKILLELADNITNDLYMNEHNYKLKNLAVIEKTVAYATNLVRDIYNSAMNGRLGDLFSKVHHESDSTIRQRHDGPATPTPKRWGFF